ncbi:hypothetical protein SDC9_66315 [bioreactor metagenome]|uniref:Uncharacterized protein n=1 Tax=bioreactor metagenome TaxID=1076179 RepID=A0A644XVU1_9ZZZZ
MPQGTFVLEFHFGFRGMDIHIYGIRLHFEIDEIIGIFGHRDQRLISRHYGLVKKWMTDITVVYEKKLIGSTLFGKLRR